MDKSSSPGRTLMEDKYLRCHLKSIKLFENSELEKAQKQLEGLYQINYKPSKYEILTLNNLALIYFKQNNVTKAYTALERALYKAKNLAQSKELLGTLINLSSVASSLGNHTDSLSYAIQARQLLPLDPKLSVQVNYNLSIEYIHLSRIQEAERILRQTLTDITDSSDNTLSQSIYSALTFIISRKSKDPEARLSKSTTESTLRKKVLKKNTSAGEFVPNSKSKKPEKPSKTLKRAESSNQISSRNTNPARRPKEKPCASNTSSTDSVKNLSGNLRSSLGSAKTIRKLLNTEKSSKQMKKSEEVGNRINIIGDHLNSIEKKLNDFVEQCKPLVTLTEDPDEQLDSHRVVKSLTSDNGKKNYSRGTRSMREEMAAVCIQRAWRKFRYDKMTKRSLIKFKDNNPLFKQIAKNVKGLRKN